MEMFLPSWSLHSSVDEWTVRKKMKSMYIIPERNSSIKKIKQGSVIENDWGGDGDVALSSLDQDL